jgi:hypothetical protein
MLDRSFFVQKCNSIKKNKVRETLKVKIIETYKHGEGSEIGQILNCLNALSIKCKKLDKTQKYGTHIFSQP